MSPLLRFVLVAGAVLVALVAGITLIATEGPEVAVLSTRAPDGTMRRTRVWVADADGAAWVEAANPERGFYGDIQRNPLVLMERQGQSRPYLARTFAGPDGNQRIRTLLRDKYGWADWWLQQMVDTSRSIAVRLDAPPSGHIAPRR